MEASAKENRQPIGSFSQRRLVALAPVSDPLAEHLAVGSSIRDPKKVCLGTVQNQGTLWDEVVSEESTIHPDVVVPPANHLVVAVCLCGRIRFEGFEGPPQAIHVAPGPCFGVACRFMKVEWWGLTKLGKAGNDLLVRAARSRVMTWWAGNDVHVGMHQEVRNLKEALLFPR
jgi:hypothetical protein